MARWRLTEPHYLKAYRARRGPTEWEYIETDRVTGEQERLRFPVPLYCDREVVVCRKGSELAEDNTIRNNEGRLLGLGPVIYDGTPTPAMEPLDEEAKTISQEASPAWGEHPIESLQSQGFSQSILSGLERQLEDLARRLPPAPSVVSDTSVSKEEFDRLKEQLAMLIAEKAEREAKPPRFTRKSA